MGDLIRRQDAIEAVYEALRTPLPCYGNNLLQDSTTLAKAIVNNIPSAESEERTAKVISDDVITVVNGYRYHYEEYLCNACKKKVFNCDSYCSHCGAKLDWSGYELRKSN